MHNHSIDVEFENTKLTDLTVRDLRKIVGEVVNEILDRNTWNQEIKQIPIYKGWMLGEDIKNEHI